MRHVHETQCGACGRKLGVLGRQIAVVLSEHRAQCPAQVTVPTILLSCRHVIEEQPLTSLRGTRYCEQCRHERTIIAYTEPRQT